MVVMLVAPQDPVVPLLGRDDEMEPIASLLDGVRQSGSVLVLRGGPGIGNSRLLAEAATLARNRQMTILSTTGVQSEARLAFSGLHQLVRPVRALAAALYPAQRAALDAAIGLADDAEPEYFRVAMAVLDLFSDVAAEAPLCPAAGGDLCGPSSSGNVVPVLYVISAAVFISGANHGFDS